MKKPVAVKKKQEWIGGPLKWGDENRNKIIKIIKKIMDENRIKIKAAFEIFKSQVLESNFNHEYGTLCKTLNGTNEIPVYATVVAWIKNDKVPVIPVLSKSEIAAKKRKEVKNDEVIVSIKKPIKKSDSDKPEFHYPQKSPVEPIWSEDNIISIISIIQEIMDDKQISWPRARTIMEQTIIRLNHNCEWAKFCKKINGTFGIPTYGIVKKWISERGIEMPMPWKNVQEEVPPPPPIKLRLHPSQWKLHPDIRPASPPTPKIMKRREEIDINQIEESMEIAFNEEIRSNKTMRKPIQPTPDPDAPGMREEIKELKNKVSELENYIKEMQTEIATIWSIL